MSDEESRQRFELLVLPHLDAAYNLARWLTHDDHDAQDVVQEAFMRAMRYIGGLRGDNARAWLLQIVRHSCFTWLRNNRPTDMTSLEEMEDAGHNIAAAAMDEPEAVAIRHADRLQLNQAIAALPFAYREVLVLRELEDLSYTDIARIADIPLGTVMSRLARARSLMRRTLLQCTAPTRRALAPAAEMGETS